MKQKPDEQDEARVGLPPQTESNSCIEGQKEIEDMPQAGPSHRKKSNTASLAFWSTLVFMAGATVVVALAGSLRPSGDGEPTFMEQALSAGERETAERVLSDGNAGALQAVVREIDPRLSSVYAPTYAAIPEYANFHYSVLGEYIEFTLAVQGRVSTKLQEQLFGGYNQRIDSALHDLEASYVETFASNFNAEIQALIDAENLDAGLGETMQLALDDAIARARVSYPIAGTTAGIVGSGGIKALTAGMASKLGAKVAAKAAAKGAVKGASVLGGVGGGAALCSWGGPLAVACGVGGGIAAWLLVDAVAVNIDELLNREEFEADLRTLIDKNKADLKQRIERALHSKAQRMEQVATKAVVEDFRWRDRTPARPDN